MEVVYSWIRNIVIYMIINTIIMNLLGNKSYKKYVSIVSGMILVLIVITPLIKLMKLEANLDYFLDANDFAIETSDFKNDLTKMEKDQMEAVFAGYEDRIITQVKNILAEEMVYPQSINVKFIQDTSSEYFGEISSINIKARMENNEVKEAGSLQIDKIEIDHISLEDQTVNKDQAAPSPLEIVIKKRLADFYHMEEGNINIEIQG